MKKKYKPMNMKQLRNRALKYIKNNGHSPTLDAVVNHGDSSSQRVTCAKCDLSVQISTAFELPFAVRFRKCRP